MKKKLMLLIMFSISLCVTSCSNGETKDRKEYLQITTLSYANGENDKEGLVLVLYHYSIKDGQMSEILRTPNDSEYPVAFADFEKNTIYFSDCAAGDNWDNLFAYDMESKTITQLTFGKFLFNDLFVASDNLIATAAPQYKIAIQPAIFNTETLEFRYLDPDDDDTLSFSLSYNHATQQLLNLTCSNAEMRSYKVNAETHIRPKTLQLMNADFSNARTIYTTDEFEICAARQMDENRILMTVVPTMIANVPCKLKVLHLDSSEIVDMEIPGILEIMSFFPTDDATGIYFTGKDVAHYSSLFYYDLTEQELTEIFGQYKAKDFGNIIDFVY